MSARAPVHLPAGSCPRCSTNYAPGQEYCLECGLRLPSARGAVPALGRLWRRHLPWYPGDWIWPALAGLAIAVLGAAVAVLSSRGGGEGTGTIVATNPVVSTQPRTTVTPPEPTIRRTTTAPPATRPTRTTPTQPTRTTPARTTPTRTTPTQPARTTPARTTPARTTTTPPADGALTAWPARKSGYTVVLSSLPASVGAGAATAKARQAVKANLPQVGFLDSSKFSSLHPGYYVVFTGVYDTLAQARQAAASARARYPSAYARQITP